MYPSAERRPVPRITGSRRDGGFTLIEVMIAMVVLALAAMAVLPLLLSGAQASNVAKLNTQAKNLAQLRLEKMRDLAFHVERQNGPYVDLLDQYYTSRSTTATTRTFGNETSVGQWVGSGTANSGEPALPFYRVTVASLPEYPQFSQVITTQFLKADGSVLPASAFPNYDSQVEANDGPPTLLVGVTVLTSWTVRGQPKVFRTYTRISDSRGALAMLTSQAKSQFLRVTSADSAGNALSSEIGLATANGSLSSGSAASVDVRAGFATDGVNPDVLAANGLATQPAGTTSGTASMSTVRVGSGPCGWTAFGQSTVGNYTAAINSGVPLVPAAVESSSPPPTQAFSGLSANGSNACGIYSFHNDTSTWALPVAPVPDASMGPQLVRIKDAGGNAQVVRSSSWLRASAITANPHTVESGVETTNSRAVQILPGLPFVTDGGGLVEVTVGSARLSCTASVVPGSSQTQSASGSYSVTVSYWRSTNASGGGQRVTTTYPWSSASSSADPLAALSPSSIVVYEDGATRLSLSDFISSWSLQRSISEGATNGVHSLDGVFTTTTVPTRDVAGVPDPKSSVGVQIGKLSCVADDNR